MSRELRDRIWVVNARAADPWLGWEKSSPEEKGRRRKLLATDLMKSIRRHCDDLEEVWLSSESEYQCSHCGYEWTEDDTTYNGGCCEEDDKNKPKDPS